MVLKNLEKFNVVTKLKIEGDGTFQSKRKTDVEFVRLDDFQELDRKVDSLSERFSRHEVWAKSEFVLIESKTESQFVLEAARNEAQFTTLQRSIDNTNDRIKTLQERFCAMEPGVKRMVLRMDSFYDRMGLIKKILIWLGSATMAIIGVLVAGGWIGKK